MAAPFGVGTAQSLASIEASVQNKLLALRNALVGVQALQRWLAGYAQTDFSGTPLSMPAADVAAIFSAAADANALASIYFTGQPPSTYPQAASAYVYANSQNPVLGPLS